MTITANLERYLKPQYVAYCILVLALMLLGLVSYWELANYNILTINSITIDAISKNVIQGDTIYFSLDYCKSKNYEFKTARLQTQLVDHLVYSMPIDYETLPSGCHVFTIAMILPTIPPGKYHLNQLRFFRLNPLRDMYISKNSDEFTMIRR